MSRVRLEYGIIFWMLIHHLAVSNLACYTVPVADPQTAGIRNHPPLVLKNTPRWHITG
jgi:hypothetical protein